MASAFFFAVVMLAAPSGTSQGRMALLPIETAGAIGVGRTDLENSALRGLATAGHPVIPPTEAQARMTAAGIDAVCRGATCWARAGALLEVEFVISGVVERAAGRFAVSLRLVRSADGAVVGSQHNDCDDSDCSVGELVRRSARELVRETLGVKTGTAPSLAAGAPEGISLAAPSDPSSGQSSARHERSVWPTVAIGGGAVAVGAGLFLIKLNNDCKDAKCTFQHDTLWWGLTAVAGGLGAVTLGVVNLMGDSAGTESSVSLGFGPGWISALGRF